MAGHGHEVVVRLFETFALGDVADGRDHRHALPVALQEVGSGFDDALRPIRALDSRLVGPRRVGVGKDGAVLLHRPRTLLRGEDDGEVVADNVLRDAPVERAVRRVDGQHNPIGIGQGQRLGRRLPDSPEALLALAPRGQFLLRPLLQIPALLLGVLALRDVAPDAGRTDDPAGLVPDGRDAHRDIEPGAVFADAHCLVMIDALAAAQPLHDGRQLARALRGDDQRDRLADRLLRRIAVETLGAPVPAGDRAV